MSKYFTPEEAGYKPGEIEEIETVAEGFETWKHRAGYSLSVDLAARTVLREGDTVLPSGQVVPAKSVEHQDLETGANLGKADEEPADSDGGTAEGDNVKGDSEAETEVEGDGLEALNGDALNEIAKAEGTTPYAKGARKAKRIEAIRAHRAANG